MIKRLSEMPIGEDYYWNVTLKWSAPRKWNRGNGVELKKRLKDKEGVYRFEMRHGSQIGRKNAYIGITHGDTFDNRLNNSTRIKEIDSWYLRGQLWISVTESIRFNGSYHTRKRYEDIEGILIYFTNPEKNEKKKKWEPSGYYKIKNLGYCGPLPYSIEYPVARIIK